MGTGRGASGRRLVAVIGGMLLVGTLGVGPAFGEPTPIDDITDGGASETSGSTDSSSGGGLLDPTESSPSSSSESVLVPEMPSYSAPTMPAAPEYSSGSSAPEFGTAQEEEESGTSPTPTTTTSGSAGQCQQLADQFAEGSAQFRGALDQIRGSQLGDPLAALIVELEEGRAQFEDASRQFFNNPLCTGSGGSGSGTEIRYETDPGSSFGNAPGIYSPYGLAQQPLYEQPVYATQVGSVPVGGVATGDGSFQP